MASPPGNGRRGLKHKYVEEQINFRRRFASRQREAWIETLTHDSTLTLMYCFASRQREAWIETILSMIRLTQRCCFASRQREAWIETSRPVKWLVSTRLRLPATGGVD